MLAATIPSLVIFGTPAENNTARPANSERPASDCCDFVVLTAGGNRRYGAPVLE